MSNRAAQHRDSVSEKATPSGLGPLYRRTDHVQQAHDAGATILFDGGMYYTLPNETSQDLWQLLDRAHSTEELVELVYELYEAPREVIARDVTAQLARLRLSHLVVETGPDGETLPPSRTWWQLWWNRR
jgi:sugar/nucleoside kinase (ribokinase family)